MTAKFPMESNSSVVFPHLYSFRMWQKEQGISLEGLTPMMMGEFADGSNTFLYLSLSLHLSLNLQA
jgi:hypothetical protein